MVAEKCNTYISDPHSLPTPAKISAVVHNLYTDLVVASSLYNCSVIKTGYRFVPAGRLDRSTPPAKNGFCSNHVESWLTFGMASGNCEHGFL